MTLLATTTVPIALVHGLLSGVRARGEAWERFLTEAEIPTEIAAQAGARVTAVQYATLFRQLIERREDEALGLLSRPLKPGSFALIARSALSAPDLATAIRRVAHVCGLLQDDVVVELAVAGELAGLTFRLTQTSSALQLVFLHEYMLRVFWRLIAWLAGGRLPAVRFDFAFEMPPHAGNYGPIFPAQLVFDCHQSAVWFDAAWLRRPVTRDETAVHSFLSDAQINIVIPRRSEEAVGNRVRRHLQAAKPAWPDLFETAQALNMSTATLQRRLATEGSSFQSLKDELRRDIAIVRLNTSTVSLMELAQDLGFSDSAAFQHAFKSWTGSAPGAYRKDNKR